MSISYRTTGAWGPGTGYDIPSADIDQSFHSLVLGAERLVNLPPVPTNGIADIRFTRTSVYVYLNNGQRLGPFDLPLPEFRWRGDWEPSTSYEAFDVFGVDGEGVFFVLHDHTSGPSFNPANPNLQLVFADLVHEVTTRPIYNVPDVDVILTASVSGWYLRCDTGCTFRMGSDAEGGWQDGANLIIRQIGTLPVFLTPQPGVNLIAPAGLLLQSNGLDGATLHLRRAANNTWDVWGDLAVDETETGTTTFDTGT